MSEFLDWLNATAGKTITTRTESCSPRKAGRPGGRTRVGLGEVLPDGIHRRLGLS